MSCYITVEEIPTFKDIILGTLEKQENWIYYTAFWCLFIFAYLSNPTSATFRTHLTSLSFHTHLRRLSSSSIPTQNNNNSNAFSLRRNTKSPSHILSFSNRISLSVATPPFTFKSYMLFSIVHMKRPPLRFNTKKIPVVIPSATSTAMNSSQLSGNSTTSNPSKGNRSKPKLRVSLPAISQVEEENCDRYFGIFGKWYILKWWSEAIEEEGRIKRLDKSVLAMDAEDEEDEKVDLELLRSPSPTPGSPTSPAKQLVSIASILSPTQPPRIPRTTKRIRSGQRRPSPNSLARLRSQADPNSPNLSNPTPLPSHPTGLMSSPDSPKTTYATIGAKNPLESFLQEMMDPPGLPFQLVSSPKRAQSPSISPTLSSIASLAPILSPPPPPPPVVPPPIPSHQLPHSHFEYSSTILPTSPLGTTNILSPQLIQVPLLSNLHSILPTSPPITPLPLPSLTSTMKELSSSTDSNDSISESLKVQLDELRALALESENRLQVELESLRMKKKEEDLFRAELKLKTKGLEELKRIAELSKADAEKLLSERKAVKRKLGERIDKVREEIGMFEKKEMEAVERKEKKKRDRKDREKRLKEEVERKRLDLVGVEAGVQKVLAKAAGVAKIIEARKDLLNVRRNDYHIARANGGGGWSDQGDGVRSSSSSFRRAPGPYYSNSSRPASLNSDHFDYYGTPYDRLSNPNSPILSRPITPNFNSEPLNYSNNSSNDPSLFYSGNFAAETYHNHQQQQQYQQQQPQQPQQQQHSTYQTGFLEHRIQHRRNEFGLSSDAGSSINYTSFHSDAPDALPSVADIPANFLPFDFDSNEIQGGRHSMEYMTPYSKRPILSLPLQYLDSGLLEASDSPGVDGPLSPMTPHQTSLIPSQLFDMLDDDEDDYELPASPTTDGKELEPWKALGLADMEPSLLLHSLNSLEDFTPSSSTNTRRTVSSPPPGIPPPGLSSMSPMSPPPGLPLNQSQASPIHSPAAIAPFEFGIHHPPTNEFNLWDKTDQASTSLLRFSPALVSPSSLSGGLGSGGIEEADDLPRHKLSLNPKVKDFAFGGIGQINSTTSSSTSSASPQPSPLVQSQSISSPRIPTSNISPITSSIVFTPPPKSRMDFANNMLGSGGSNGSNSSNVAGVIGSGVVANSATATSGSSSGESGGFSRFTFDWGRTSPKVTTKPTSAPGSAGHAATGSTSSFNPFDADELLGPLKK